MQLDLAYLLRIARRWWWLLVLAPMVGGVAAYSASNRQPEMYAADATMFLSAGVSSIATNGQGQNLMQTYTEWVVSRPVLESAAEVLAYDGGADRLAGHISSAMVEGTLYITVTATDTDPERAADIANTVANEFVLDVARTTEIQNEQVRSQITDRIANTTDQISQLNASIRDLETRQLTLTTAESAELQELRQDRTNLEGELNQLQATLRAIDVELASARTAITVPSEAVPNWQPYAPDTTRAAMIGGVMGIILAVGAIVALEYMDNTVRNREELARLAGSPVLAAIASATSLKRGGSGLFVLDEPNSAAAEAMRLLRANLEFASAPDRVTSLAITSPGPGEGKSTLAANLGVVMAHAGLKTIIIDADLRRPMQHTIFGVDNKRGLSTLLATPDPDWRQGAMSLSIHNLVLIPSGPLPPNPSDLLSLDRFQRILADLNTWADVVLIDCTPMLSASDALVVATKTRGALLVCRTGQTRNDAVRRATAALQHARVRLTGVVLNVTQSDDIDHYGEYAERAATPAPLTPRYYFGRQTREAPIAGSSPVTREAAVARSTRDPSRVASR